MTQPAPCTDVDDDDALDELEVNARVFARFLEIADGEVTELTALPSGRGVPWVAHAHGTGELVRLVRDGEELTGTSGVYVVANVVHPGIGARYIPGRWHRGDSLRANDGEITQRRVVYVDLDSIRPRGISATDEEKRPVYDVADEIETFLETAIPQSAIGRGDSGNGLAIFIALEPTPVNTDTNKKIERFLKAMQAKFQTDRVQIDTSVFNPARLVPMFGSTKRKGIHTKERPHRRTYFTCRGRVVRVPLEVL